MKKLLAILTLASVVCVSSAAVLAGHSASHSYSKKNHKETVTISGLELNNEAMISVEVWDSKYNLAWNTVKKQKGRGYSSSLTASVKNKKATRGYYAYYSKDWLGNLGVWSKGAWETNIVK